MKNKICKFIYLLIFSLLFSNANSQEQFNFDVTQIDILENGNKFIGTKRGTITSDDGILAIGSGGNYALAAARALLENTDFSPAQIVSKALKITSQICIYTNDQIEIIELT